MTAKPTRLPVAAQSQAETGSPDGSHLPVSETFTSVQGEGFLMGVPSFFIRLSGCNLRCTWCDTPYASWEPDGAPMAIDALVRLARESGVRHAVVTGGEPMMFARVVELCERLAAPIAGGGAGMHITIETAGTVHPGGHIVCHLMSISPKLASSAPPGVGDPRDPSGAWAKRHHERRTNLPVLQWLLDEFPAPARQLKFVVTSERPEEDIREIESLLARLRGVTAADVLLMPEGVAAPSEELRRFVLETCVQRSWRYCHRLHIELFGNRRGT